MIIPYERIEHTADLAIRVYGRDLPDLFANAAAALFDLMAVPPQSVRHLREVVIESVDLEGLMVDWLNDLIFLHEVHKETYTRFEIVAFEEDCLRAILYGGPTYVKVKTIKAATFNDILVAETDVGAQAQIVFDV